MCVLRLIVPILPDDEVDEIVSLRFDGGEDDTDDDEMDLSGSGAVTAQSCEFLMEALGEDGFKAIETDMEKRKTMYLKGRVRQHQHAVAAGKAKAKASANGQGWRRR